LICGGWHLKEFFSGGMGRLAPFPPAGLDGCRAPTPTLLCYGGSLLLRNPKWCIPGGGAVAAQCNFFIGGEVGAKRDLIAFLAFLPESLLQLFWVGLYFPLCLGVSL
jgi:hypothetical protein